jgi:trimeric autotransporter adhesin
MRRISLGLAALVMACSGPTGSGSTGPSAPVASVTVQPVTTSLTVGTSLALTVILRDAAGTMLANRTITFSSSNESVLSVDATGLVRALTEGEATITASSEGKSGQTTISVHPEDPDGSPWDY